MLKNKKNKSAVALGKKGGSVKSKKKSESSRKNGKLGGRPMKIGNAIEQIAQQTLNILIQTMASMRNLPLYLIALGFISVIYWFW